MEIYGNGLCEIPFEIKCKPRTQTLNEKTIFRLKEDCFPRYIESRKPIFVGVNSGINSTHEQKDKIGLFLFSDDLKWILKCRRPMYHAFGDKPVYSIDARHYPFFNLHTLEPLCNYVYGLGKCLQLMGLTL